MKKKLIILLIILSMFTSTAVVTAATGMSIKATLTKLQVYFGGSRLSGSVINYKNVNYIPARILSDKLEYDVNTNSSKITITEDESKDSLRNEIKGYQKQIKELNKKLDVYRGYIPDDASYSTIKNFNIIDDEKVVYQSYWNKATPFKVNGEIYDKNTYGVLFESYSDWDKNKGFPAFEFINRDLAYTKLKFTCAIDDLGIDLQNNAETRVAVVGYSESLGNNTLLDKIIDRINGIETLEVDIRGYDKIAIKFMPSYTSGYGFIIRDYVLLINPEVK